MLLERLAKEIRAQSLDLKRSWPKFRQDPVGEGLRTFRFAFGKAKDQFHSPTRLLSYVSACSLIIMLITVVGLLDSSRLQKDVTLREDSLIDLENVQLLKIDDEKLAAGIG